LNSFQSPYMNALVGFTSEMLGLVRKLSTEAQSFVRNAGQKLLPEDFTVIVYSNRRIYCSVHEEASF
jgi:hypothetical protein